MPQNIIIKKSKISGQGVFAGKSFKKGQIILRWKKNKLLSKGQLNKLPRREKIYVIHYEKNKYLLMQPPERYVNHSCEPNTYTKNYRDVALKFIKEGEEITSCYSSAENLVKFRCHCGGKKCKKFIAKN